MDLPVAVGMQQHPILGTVRSTARAPDDVVVVPPRQGRYGLTTHGAVLVRFSAQVKHLPAGPDLGRHLHAPAGGKVALPGRVIGVGIASYFDMPATRRCRQLNQVVLVGVPEPGLMPGNPHWVLPTVVKERWRIQRRALWGWRRLVHRHRVWKIP
jgi:hypothetical protein